ncbi:hypothetical protein HNQ69_000547 [Bartonella callosciuri]|uniref:Uncharacterized protein n=1 Tax=Bartonella callosciuri TaxID=686223 RepID=A0A840NLB0_9HYPH|nr:hypothetical protein [Bartonella callosciuri]
MNQQSFLKPIKNGERFYTTIFITNIQFLISTHDASKNIWHGLNELFMIITII